MKRISQIALIFLPIQAISGFFGMNVKVPWQADGADSVVYFWILVLISGVVAATMYLSRSFFLRELNWGAQDAGKKPARPSCWERRRLRRQANETDTLPTLTPSRF